MTGKVVVGYSADVAGRAALRMAVEEARLRNATLTIVHELVGTERPDRFGRDSDFIAAQRAASPAIRAALAEVAPSLNRYELALVTSPVADELALLSRTADLVVLGVTTSSPTQAALFDTIPSKVLARAECPVMLVPARIRHAPVQLVCGVDRSPGSASALTWAAADAGRRGVTLLAVGVEPLQPSRADRQESLVDWVGAQHPIAETTVLCSRVHSRHPAKLLIDIAERRQALLVVGARENDGHRWDQSVARKVSAQTRVAVVVVPTATAEPTTKRTPALRVLAAH